MTRSIGNPAHQRNVCITWKCYGASTMDILLPLDFKEFLKYLNERAVTNKKAAGRYKDMDDFEHLS